MPDGQALECTGENGNSTHQEAVLTYLGHQIVRAMRECGKLHWLWPQLTQAVLDDRPMFRTIVNDAADAAYQQKILTAKQADDIWGHIAKVAGVTARQIDWVISGDYDLREVAMKEFGWIRLAGPNIEMFAITDDKLRRVWKHLEHKFGFASDSTRPFLIENKSTGRYFRDVPLSVIALGKVMKLSPYRNTQQVAASNA